MLNPCRFYVYLHKRADTGQVFYVGQGSGNRHSQAKTGRNKEWLNIFNVCGFYSEIYKDQLTKDQALVLEKELIHNPKSDWALVNKVYQKSRTKEYVLEDFRGFVEYSPFSPSGVVWSIDEPVSGKKRGQPAGCQMNTNQRWIICCNRKKIYASRLIYLLHFGTLDPTKVIDHIDGDPSNNKIENLREVSSSYNNKNRLSDEHIPLCTVKCKRHIYYRYSIVWRDEFSVRHRKYFGITQNRTKEQALALATEFRDSLVAQGLILTRKK